MRIIIQFMAFQSIYFLRELILRSSKSNPTSSKYIHEFDKT
jgi:hypothetical protein